MFNATSPRPLHSPIGAKMSSSDSRPLTSLKRLAPQGATFFELVQDFFNATLWRYE